MAPKIVIAAMVCFFPTLINTVRGLEAVNPQIMELMRMLSATRTQIYFKLRLFSALPYLFSALRIAASMCVIGAIVGEWIGATQGIGAQIIQATYNYDSPLLYAAIVMSALLSGLFYVVIALLEKRIVKWS
jgi:NitT/TauT family transport system permease protein